MASACKYRTNKDVGKVFTVLSQRMSERFKRWEYYSSRYVAEHSRANIMVVEDEEQLAKVCNQGFLAGILTSFPYY